MDTRSKQVLCCGSRMWAAVIGWVQSIINALALVFYCVTWVSFVTEVVWSPKDAEADHKAKIDEEEETKPIIVGTGLALQTVISILSLIGGIVLILGVKQERSKKVKISLGLQILSVALIIADLLIGLICGARDIFLTVLIRDIILIFVGGYSIIVVVCHIRELHRFKAAMLVSQIESSSVMSRVGSKANLVTDFDHHSHENSCQVEHSDEANACVECTFVY